MSPPLVRPRTGSKIQPEEDAKTRRVQSLEVVCDRRRKIIEGISKERQRLVIAAIDAIQHKIIVNEEAVDLDIDVSNVGADGTISEEEVEAMKKELRGISEMEAVKAIVIESPHGKKIVGTRWVKTYPSTGGVKMRLVATQVAHTAADYTLFASTPSNTSLRVFLADASWKLQVKKKEGKKFTVVSLDVSKAFLHAPWVEGEVLLRPPRCLGLPKNVFWLVKKALYGLRASPAAWAKFLRELLKELGFSPCRADPCLYKHEDGTSLIVHVDDLLISGEEDVVMKIVQLLRERLRTSEPEVMRNPGDSLSMLSRTITMTPRGFLYQSDPKHAKAIIDEVGVQGAKRGQLPRTEVIV